VPIHADASGLEILVGGTDEEALIAREKYRLLENPILEEENRLHDAQTTG
jgi:hypothetical protein